MNKAIELLENAIKEANSQTITNQEQLKLAESDISECKKAIHLLESGVDYSNEFAELFIFCTENGISVEEDGSNTVENAIKYFHKQQQTITALTEQEQSEQSKKLIQEVIKENKTLEEFQRSIFDIIFEHDADGPEFLNKQNALDYIKNAYLSQPCFHGKTYSENKVTYTGPCVVCGKLINETVPQEFEYSVQFCNSTCQIDFDEYYKPIGLEQSKFSKDKGWQTYEVYRHKDRLNTEAPIIIKEANHLEAINSKLARTVFYFLNEHFEASMKGGPDNFIVKAYLEGQKMQKKNALNQAETK